MKKSIILCMMICFSLCLSGCTEAERVSYNISQQADNFNVLRQLTVINNVTGDTTFYNDRQIQYQCGRN